ncbi:hypothetical protein FRX31_023490, partial [Thalictrum thalictroides]
VVDMSRGQGHVPGDSENNVVFEEGQSSESVTNINNLGGPLQDNDSSDASLRLGLFHSSFLRTNPLKKSKVLPSGCSSYSSSSIANK